MHYGCDGLEGVVPRHRPSLKAVQPVKEFHQHSQRFELLLQHHLARIRSPFICDRAILELQVLPLKRDGVIEEEPRGWFENVRGEIIVKRARDIGEHEGNIGRGPVEGGRYGGEYTASADSDTGDVAIGEYEDGSGGVDVLLDLGLDTFCLEPVFQKPGSVGEPRRVDDADLGRRLRTLVMLTMASTYHYTVLACTFINASRVGRSLISRSTLLVGGVKDIEIVVVNVVAGKDIGDEFQE